MFIGPALLKRLVADKSSVPLEQVDKVLSAQNEVTLYLLKSGAKVRALGVGYFTVIVTKATRRASLHADKLVKVPAKRKIVFRESRRK